jgi:5-methylcytosine-specific restriction enzyme A
MPTLGRPGCRWPLCANRSAPGGSYCTDHQRAKWQALDRDRGSSSQRGYSADWQRFRRWFLSQPEHVMCEDCRRVPSVEVHHVLKVKDRPDLRLVESNCRGLCVACHLVYTRRGL